MKINEFLNELYMAYNHIMYAFIHNFKYNKLSDYRELVKVLNNYLQNCENAIDGMDENKSITAEIINPFNQMVDWAISLNAGFKDMVKYKIKAD